MPIRGRCPYCGRTANAVDPGSSTCVGLECAYCGKSFRVIKIQGGRWTARKGGGPAAPRISTSQSLDLSEYRVGDLVATITLCLVFAMACFGCAFLVGRWDAVHPDYPTGTAGLAFAIVASVFAVIGLVFCWGVYFQPALFDLVPKPNLKERLSHYALSIVFFVLPAVIIFSVSLFVYRTSDSQIRPFEELISTKHTFWSFPNVEDITDVNDHIPYFRGKGVIVDLDKRRIDLDLQRRLPLRLRASRRDEVRTAIWLKRGVETVGVYAPRGSSGGSGGPRASQRYCTITVIDMSRPAIVARTTLRGSRPQAVARNISETVGDKVSPEAIISHLCRLRLVGANDTSPAGP